MRDWNDYDYECEDDGVPLALKIMAYILCGGFSLFILAVFAKVVVDLWTGGCAV